MFYESLYQSHFVETASGGAGPELVSSFSSNAKKPHRPAAHRLVYLQR
jgi:hypothetical protein